MNLLHTNSFIPKWVAILTVCNFLSVIFRVLQTREVILVLSVQDCELKIDDEKLLKIYLYVYLFIS